MRENRAARPNGQNMERIRSIGEWIVELLFPRRCPLCDEVIGFAQSCADCEPELRHLVRQTVYVERQTHEMTALDAVIAGLWYEDAVREAIKRLKFAERTDLIEPFAKRAAQTLRDADAVHPVDFDIIIPVPSSAKELRERGYDVPKLLAKRIAKETGRPMQCALDKIRETQRQRTLSGAQRRKNVKGAFALKPTVSVQGHSCLIVDDVFTTGATMNECAKMLVQAGAAHCIGLVIAVTR